MKHSRHERPVLSVLVPLLAAGLVFAAACGKKAPSEEASEKMISDMVAKATEGRADIDFKSGQITVKTPEGDAVITSGGGSWPADLPEDLTPFRAGSIQSSTNYQTPGGRTWTVMFTGAAADEVEAYIESLKGDGWNVAVTSDVPQGRFTQLQREDFFIQLTYLADESSLAMNIIRQAGD